jgi:tetratricopeptide (TPR) repeat protein
MSTPSSRRSPSIAARNARPGRHQRNGRPAAAGEPSPGSYNGRPRAVPDLPREPINDQRWDERIAREVRHQEVIEASFDRAEAYERLGDFEHALEWLDRAAALSGGLPAAFRARRARWARAAAVRPGPAGGDWKIPLAR